MNSNLPDPIRVLATQFRSLPGVGPKTALRFVFALLKEPREKTERLAQLLINLHAYVKSCSECGSYALKSPCMLCLDPKREKQTLCIVAESRDIATIETTGEFHGYYFVLGGLLSPLEGATPDTLRIQTLIDRIAKSPEIKEIIFAFNPDLPGESTILYLAKQLASFPVTLTSLARGLPLGADLEYADEVTLADALKGRRSVTPVDNAAHRTAVL